MIARVVDREWEIENIAVAGPARRRGLGTRLLGELLDLARGQRRRRQYFWKSANPTTRRGSLYEKWAFLESGRRRGYYKDPEEDAILYRLDSLALICTGRGAILFTMKSHSSVENRIEALRGLW